MSVDNGRYENKVALVTGAGSGIGEAVARGLDAEGCSAVYLGDIDQGSVERLASELQSGRPAKLDVSDSAAVDALIESIIEEQGRLDVLVHAAGVDDAAVKGRVAEDLAAGRPVDLTSTMTDDEWHRMLNVNLTGTFYVLRGGLRKMKLQNSGSIVVIGSESAFETIVGYPHYVASKGGVHALSQSVAKEAMSFGVRVNVVAPGLTATGMASRTPASLKEIISQAPGRGYASPAEIADSVVYLASDGATNIVGAVLLSNGGKFTV